MSDGDFRALFGCGDREESRHFCFCPRDGLIEIAANGNESAQLVEEAAKTRGIPKVLIDAQHVIADKYAAMTTPHVFVLDRAGILRYRGAVDDVTFRRREATQFFLRDAVEALLQEQVPELSETPAYGCTIVREI